MKDQKEPTKTIDYLALSSKETRLHKAKGSYHL